MDEKGADLAARVSFETLNDQLESVPRSSASKYARAQRETLLRLVDSAQASMQPQHTERVEQLQRALPLA